MAGTLFALAGGAAAYIAALFNGQTPLHGVKDINTTLAPLLSPDATIWLPGSEGHVIATNRWSPRTHASFDIVIDVATEDDVGHAIRYANANDMPFLAISGKHGYNNKLNKVRHGVGISMRKLNNVELAQDGKSATVGGGIVTRQLTDVLWESGKMTTVGACECTGAVSPMLGGGHGFMQGEYGLMADNLLAARLVLANGTSISVSNNEHPDLFWALRGAGHNFGIVTSFQYQVHDRTKENENFAIETIIFTGDKLEDVYTAGNKVLENRPVELTWFSMLFPMPDVDPDKPVIIVVVIWQGASSVPQQYTSPFSNLNPVAQTSGKTDFVGLAAVLSLSMESPGCQPGTSWIPFPVGTVDIPISGLREAYEIQASLPPSMRETWTIIEGYSMAGVQEVDSNSTAFPERQNNLLISPFVMYKPTGNSKEDKKADAEAFQYGKRIRDAIARAAGGKLHAYVNYISGDEETLEEKYGHEAWRLEKLRRLKKQYDPKGRFSFYNPIS